MRVSGVPRLAVLVFLVLWAQHATAEPLPDARQSSSTDILRADQCMSDSLRIDVRDSEGYVPSFTLAALIPEPSGNASNQWMKSAPPPENFPPVAHNQSVVTDEDTEKPVTLLATDPDGDSLTYLIVTGPSHGSVSGTPPEVTYTPEIDFNGSDSFTFKAWDGSAFSNIGTVTIIVLPVNDPPVALDQSSYTDEDTSAAITLTAFDVDGDHLTYSYTQPLHGTVTGTGPAVTYSPDANYHGSDSFTFKVNDGTVDSNTATVSITVGSVNDAPVMSPIEPHTVDEGQLLSFTVAATDPDDDSITLSAANLPLGAAFADHGDGTGTLTWQTGYDDAGTYSNVTFTATDDGVPPLSDSVSTTITVIEVYRLTVSVVGEGSVEFSPAPPYHPNDLVTLTAFPTAGWTFADWSGDVVSDENPVTIIMDDDKSVTATFTRDGYQLIVTVEGEGNVGRSLDPPYYFNDVVILIPEPASGWEFSHWSGDVPEGHENDDPLPLFMDSDKSLTATFAPRRQYELNVEVAGEGSVNRSLDPPYYFDDVVILIPEPASGWEFSHWSGDVPEGHENDDPLPLFMDSDKSLTATFAPRRQYELNVEVAGEGSVNRSLDPPYYFDDVVILIPEPASGWEFSHWSGDVPEGHENDDPLQLFMDSDRSLTVTFTVREDGAHDEGEGSADDGSADAAQEPVPLVAWPMALVFLGAGAVATRKVTQKRR